MEIGIAGTTTRPGSGVVRTPERSGNETWLYCPIDPVQIDFVLSWNKRPENNNYYPLTGNNSAWSPDNYESLAAIGKAVAKGGPPSDESNGNTTNHSQRFVKACELVAETCDKLTKASYTIRRDGPGYGQAQILGIPLGFIHPSNILVNLDQGNVVLTDIGWYPNLNKSTLCANGAIWHGIYQQVEIESICNEIIDHDNDHTAERIKCEKVRLAKVIELALTDGKGSLNQLSKSLFINPNWQNDLSNIGSTSKDFKEFADKIREIGQPPKPETPPTHSPVGRNTWKKTVKTSGLALIICGMALASAYHYKTWPFRGSGSGPEKGCGGGSGSVSGDGSGSVPGDGSGSVPGSGSGSVPGGGSGNDSGNKNTAVTLIKDKNPMLAEKYKSIASKISSQETIEEIRFQESFRSELRSFLTELESIIGKENDPANKGVLDNFKFYLKSYLEE